jgi:DNA-binding LacI/PurR family transcriptional regulator
MLKIENITKFEQLIDILREDIWRGYYPEGVKLPSERDLAKTYGMSHMTVNKALANLVSQNVLKRVHGVGTFVRDSEMPLPYKLIGVAVNTDLKLHFRFPLLLPPVIQKAGYYPVMLSLSQTREFRSQLRDFLLREPFALIMDGYSKAPLDMLDELRGKTKLIIVSRYDGDKKYPGSYILADHRAGGYMAARHLLSQGRRKILLITYNFNPEKPGAAGLFRDGCKAALDEAGAGDIQCVSGQDANEELYSKILSSANRPDCILSLMDSYLVPIVELCKKKNIKIPEELALIGYNNTPWAESYGLTSVSPEEETIAEEAGRALESDCHREIMVKPRIVFRQSCRE